MSTDSQPKYITVQEFCKKYSWPPEGGLRHLIHNSEKNGFHKVIRRAGNRILIIEQEFFNWIEEQNNAHEKTIAANDNKKNSCNQD